MIKLKSLLSEALNKVPDYLYHATFKALIPKIKHVGLIPGGEDFRNYENIEWGVYLSDDYDFAGSMAETTENENVPEKWLDEIVVIMISTKNLNRSMFDVDPNIILWQNEDSHSFIYRGKIPPSEIIDIVNYS
jgi:hypothetical protein